MNSAPRLLPEDRPEFERAVDEALREAGRRPALTGVGEQISAGQLRVMALSAATAIAGEAADEYERYVALRTRLRERPADASRGTATPERGSAQGAQGAPESARAQSRRGAEQRGGGGGLSLAGVGESAGEQTSGAGLLAMVSVLVPLLAGAAAVIFLLLGYVLQVVSPEPSIAAPMRGAGWVFAVLAAIGIVVATAELWLTAVRNGTRRGPDGEQRGVTDRPRPADEVSAARAAWREALLERGIVPFLADALAAQTAERQPSQADPHGTEPDGPRSAEGEDTDGEDTDGSAAHDGPSPAASATTPASGPVREAHRTEERTPRLGYSHPHFSSRTPSDGTEHRSVRPRYSSPDYSSPDYGGPEHKPE